MTTVHGTEGDGCESVQRRAGIYVMSARESDYRVEKGQDGVEMGIM